MTTCQRPLDNVFDNFRTKCAILMKFCTSEQNLVTNILKINLSPQLAPNEIVYGKNIEINSGTAVFAGMTVNSQGFLESCAW